MYKRQEYDGQLCHIDLDGATDAYEVSLVAVPAQPAAGAIKSKRYGGAGSSRRAASRCNSGRNRGRPV